MPTTYPGAKHVIANPTPTTPTTDSMIPHAAQHTDVGDLAEALQDKLGIGSTGQAPTADTVLRGIAAGQTDYGKIANAHVDPAAAIAYNKLSLVGSIMNSDVNGAAAIGLAKLAHVGAGNVLRSNGSVNVAGQVVDGDVAAGPNISWTKLKAQGVAQTIPYSADGTNVTNAYPENTFRANVLPGLVLADNSIWADYKLQNGSIGYQKYANQSVGTAALADGQTTTAKLAAEAATKVIFKGSSQGFAAGSGAWTIDISGPDPCHTGWVGTLAGAKLIITVCATMVVTASSSGYGRIGVFRYDSGGNVLILGGQMHSCNSAVGSNWSCDAYTLGDGNAYIYGFAAMGVDAGSTISWVVDGARTIAYREFKR